MAEDKLQHTSAEHGVGQRYTDTTDINKHQSRDYKNVATSLGSDESWVSPLFLIELI